MQGLCRDCAGTVQVDETNSLQLAQMLYSYQVSCLDTTSSLAPLNSVRAKAQSEIAKNIRLLGGLPQRLMEVLDFVRLVLYVWAAAAL